MKEELKKALYPLYEELAQIDSEQGYTTFCAEWGRKYQKGGMLFVGRAVNGWKTDCRDVELLFKEGDVNQIFAREDRMRWIKECPRSQFWRVARAVSQDILGVDDDWYEHIAYSNLYKLAPDGANPSTSLRNKQEDVCYRIFKVEIETLQPKVVVMLAGIDWYEDFMSCLNGEMYPEPIDKAVIPYSADKSFEIYTYRIGDVIYIGSLHPQGKPEQPHIEGIIEAIKKAQ